MPATEEQDGHHRAHQNDVEVFTQHKKEVRRRAILDLVTRHEFGFGFRKIKRRAVGFSQRRDKEDHEHREHHDDQREVLEAERVPVLQAAGLVVDDVAEVHRADQQDDRDDHEADGDLVGYHLRGRAQRAEERILRVRRPAAHDDTVDTQGADREEIEDADIQVRDHPARSLLNTRRNRDGRPGGEGQRTGEDRRKDEDELVGAGRDDDFFQQEFPEVGKRLEQAERAHHVRAFAHHHAGPDFPVEQQQECNRQQQNEREQADLAEHQKRPPKAPQRLDCIAHGAALLRCHCGV